MVTTVLYCFDNASERALACRVSAVDAVVLRHLVVTRGSLMAGSNLRPMDQALCSERTWILPASWDSRDILLRACKETHCCQNRIVALAAAHRC